MPLGVGDLRVFGFGDWRVKLVEDAVLAFSVGAGEHAGLWAEAFSEGVDVGLFYAGRWVGDDAVASGSRHGIGVAPIPAFGMVRATEYCCGGGVDFVA
ncbi:hypothetical protein [Cutibacterium modestum]|uniref:hypothetical protein n=1 Tax=Cutibacterium modestum TaxID=2559073 RepID=UPI001ABE3C2F|nr:hypothetical protein [Cutibacterium modestum]